MEDRVWVVYKHTNKLNNKSYIGITSRKPEIRWGSTGWGYATQSKFYNAIKKYGWDNFDHEIIASKLTQDEASNFEILLIKEFDSISNGYNTSEGGKLGSGMKKDKHQMAKRVICLNNMEVFGCIEDASDRYGIDSSYLAKVCKGKNKSAGKHPLTNEKLLWAYYEDGVDCDELKIEKKNELNNTRYTCCDNKAKMVVCLETGEVFDSATKAQKEYSGGISKSCRTKGVMSGGSYNGIKLHWRFYDELILESEVDEHGRITA